MVMGHHGTPSTVSRQPWRPTDGLYRDPQGPGGRPGVQGPARGTGGRPGVQGPAKGPGWPANVIHFTPTEKRVG